jgi:hypothetical protein
MAASASVVPNGRPPPVPGVLRIAAAPEALGPEVMRADAAGTAAVEARRRAFGVAGARAGTGVAVPRDGAVAAVALAPGVLAGASGRGVGVTVGATASTGSREAIGSVVGPSVIGSGVGAGEEDSTGTGIRMAAANTANSAAVRSRLTPTPP